MSLTLAGFIVSVVGLVASFIYFYVQRARKGLIYELISNSPLIMTTENIGGDLQVVFNGKPVEHAHLLIIRLANSGNRPIQPPDFSDAIRVRLEEHVDILSADVVDATPPSLESLVRTDIASKAVSIEPLLLNPRDSFSLRLFVNQASPDVKVEARIAGISDAVRQETVPPEKLSLQMNQMLVWVLLGIVIPVSSLVSLSGSLR